MREKVIWFIVNLYIISIFTSCTSNIEFDEFEIGLVKDDFINSIDESYTESISYEDQYIQGEYVGQDIIIKGYGAYRDKEYNLQAIVTYDLFTFDDRTEHISYEGDQERLVLYDYNFHNVDFKFSKKLFKDLKRFYGEPDRSFFETESDSYNRSIWYLEDIIVDLHYNSDDQMIVLRVMMSKSYLEDLISRVDE